MVIAAFVVRPYLQITRARSPSSFQATIAAYQLAENQPIDPSRQYYELSLHWVFWYIGIPAVILGTAAAALLVYRCVRRQAPAWTLPLLVFSWAIVSTLYRPAITPDQPWASRRLVPAVLPGFLILAVWVIRWAYGWLRARGAGKVVRGGVVAICAAALIVPATITTFGLALHTGGQGGVRLTADGLGLKTTYAGRDRCGQRHVRRDAEGRHGGVHRRRRDEEREPAARGRPRDVRGAGRAWPPRPRASGWTS